MSNNHRRGRPPAQSSQQVCEDLLTAAEQCALNKPIRNITGRDIATMAKVTQAMINYYFANKDGLYIALIEFQISDWERKVQALVATMPHLTKAPTAELVALIDQCFYRRGTVIKILVRELTETGSAVRSAYWEKLTSRISDAWRHYLNEAIRHGLYRDDFNPDHALMSILGLAMLPQSLDEEVLDNVYHMSKAGLSDPDWLKHVETCIDNLFEPR